MSVSGLYFLLVLHLIRLLILITSDLVLKKNFRRIFTRCTITWIIKVIFKGIDYIIKLDNFECDFTYATDMKLFKFNTFSKNKEHKIFPVVIFI